MMGGLQAKQTTELSDDINVLTAEIKVDLQGISEGIFRVGARLKKVRDNPEKYGFEGYRDWERWCKEEFAMTRGTANKFIRVFERFGSGSLGSRLPSSITVLYELTSFTDEELERPRQMPDGTVKKLTEMSRREIEEVKRALKEAEKRAEQAERYAEEKENEVERLKSRPKPEPRVEVRTEYVEVEDQKTRERLRKYEERFGDIEDYDERVTASNRQDLTVSVISFNKAVRDLAKRYSYMTQYKNLVAELDEVTRKEYNQAVKVLQELAHDFDFADEKTGAIDAEYVEIN